MPASRPSRDACAWSRRRLREIRGFRRPSTARSLRHPSAFGIEAEAATRRARSRTRRSARWDENPPDESRLSRLLRARSRLPSPRQRRSAAPCRPRRRDRRVRARRESCSRSRNRRPRARVVEVEAVNEDAVHHHRIAQRATPAEAGSPPRDRAELFKRGERDRRARGYLVQANAIRQSPGRYFARSRTAAGMASNSGRVRTARALRKSAACAAEDL